MDRERGQGCLSEVSGPLSINGTSYTLVKTIATLAKLIAKKPTGAYALSNDYDASADGTYTTSPVTTIFAGTFEGLGNTISNLTIVANDTKHFQYIGLFSETSGSGGVIENLRLTNILIKSSKMKSTTGALAGGAGLTLVFNDSASGRVSGGTGSDIGGLLGGEGSAEVLASHSNVRVTGGKNSFVGGLVGMASGGEVVNSYSVGQVSGKYIAGGLIGESQTGEASGSLTGSVSAGYEGGGLVGANISGGVVINSYATGAVTGGSSSAAVGGLVGVSEGGATGGIGYSYSTGSVTGGPSAYVGGLLGEDLGNVLIDNYWDTDTSGQSQGAGNISNDPGITGLTTEELQSGLPTGFDPSIWAEDSGINNGFPYLLANPPPK